jgi:predicted membrane GTPase involved in stress response
MRSSGKDKPSELTPAIRFPLERVIESIDPATPGHL